MKLLIEAYLRFSAWMLLLSFVFFLLESWRPATPLATRRDRLPNCVYLVLALPAILLLSTSFSPIYYYLIKVADGGLVAHFYASSETLIGTILFALAYAIVWDVWQYGVHRLQHASASLWQTHRFHHSDEAVNATTQGRHHFLSHLLNLILLAPMLLLFGALNPHALAGVILFRIWGFVNHANVRVGFGPLTGIIAGPQWHRIHHSIRPEHRDKNFATFFPFIDRLFGTCYIPAHDEYPATGIAETAHESFASQASFGPLLQWWTRLVAASQSASSTMRDRVRRKAQVGET